MAKLNFPPPPTFANPVIYDEATKTTSFNPIWLNWFLQISQGLNQATNDIAGPTDHEALSGLQGGAPNDHRHLTETEYTALIALLPP